MRLTAREDEFFELYVETRGLKKTLERLAEVDIGRPEGGPYSKEMAYKWLKESEARWERWQEVKRLVAQMLADEALEDAENATRGNVALARLRVEHKQWLAERYDRNVFGRAPTVAVQVNVGSSWLDALKRAESEVVMDPPEVVEGDS